MVVDLFLSSFTICQSKDFPRFFIPSSSLLSLSFLLNFSGKRKKQREREREKEEKETKREREKEEKLSEDSFLLPRIIYSLDYHSRCHSNCHCFLSSQLLSLSLSLSLFLLLLSLSLLLFSFSSSDGGKNILFDSLNLTPKKVWLWL